MVLSQLLKNIKPTQVVGSTDVDITGVNIDSRRIKPGHLFVAMKGTQVDGHKFIDKAIELGAKAVLCEDMPATLADGVTYVQVASTEDAVGKVATMFYGDPSTKLKLVGVTGTNGKTTIATLLYNMFSRMGHKCGLLSTVCNYVVDEAIPADHTTPDPIELNALLAKMVEAKCEYAFMECSSHAIAQKRIGGLTFTGGIFTNLTRDHLDYHKTFEGMYLDIDGHEVGVNFIGKFNVSNLLAVYGAAVMLGKKPEDVLVVMSTLHSVNGRLDPIQTPGGFTAVIDYAHTPDALENVLNAIHEVLNGKGQVITVCGAGGNRDKGKRPLMAQEAVKQSDKVIITSDNPRFEEPQDIINDMLAGLNAQQMKKVISIVDRREAIRTACMMAQKGDVVLIAGKGHENYQDVKGVKHHFDDHEVVREVCS